MELKSCKLLKKYLFYGIFKNAELCYNSANFQFFAVFRGDYHCGAYSPAVHLLWGERSPNFWRNGFSWNFAKTLKLLQFCKTFSFLQSSEEIITAVLVLQQRILGKVLHYLANGRTLAVGHTLERSIFPGLIQPYRNLQALVYCFKDRRKKDVSWCVPIAMNIALYLSPRLLHSLVASHAHFVCWVIKWRTL